MTILTQVSSTRLPQFMGGNMGAGSGAGGFEWWFLFLEREREWEPFFELQPQAMIYSRFR